MSEQIYFKLFACCIPVKGAVRSCLCDIQRGVVKFIPNLGFGILTDFAKDTIEEIKAKHDTRNHKEINDFFSILVKEEWGFYTSEPEKFPTLELTWETPLEITNAILDYDENWGSQINDVLQQLNDLGCEALQLRVYNIITLEKIDNLLGKISTSRLRSVELVIKYDSYFNDEALLNLSKKHRRIRSIIVHSSPINRSISDLNKYLLSISYVDSQIDSHFHCGQINESFFSLNIETFTESQHYNSCLNRKISIDAKGEIKNCPSIIKSFGNISNTTLKQVLEKKGFTTNWNIVKDKIAVCKDCEFRYVCTDCRAYIENPEDIYSKPLKCGYSPYTNTWEEWSTNPLKQKAIEYYGGQT